MTNIVPIHELQRQRREVQKQDRINSYRKILLDRQDNAQSMLRAGPLVHVKNDKLIVGVENKYGTITPLKNLSFADRCSVNYINQQRVLGSSWSNIK